MKLAVAEPESPALRTYLGPRSHRVVASVVASIEVPRAVRRAGGNDELAVAVLRRVTLVRLSDAVCRRARELEPDALRTLDAIHLASAMEVGDLEAFVAYDGRFAQAAAAIGLAVVAPGTE